ncbi:MAG: zinc ribbon domain-containing protein [Nitrososphaeria archaeon]
MVFCSRCGKELAEDAFFCPKCGYKTLKGTEAGVVSPYEDWRETLSRMGKEMEKAFDTAAKEIEKAFSTAKKSIQDSTGTTPTVCPSCGTSAKPGAVFCTNCGNRLRE